MTTIVEQDSHLKVWHVIFGRVLLPAQTQLRKRAQNYTKSSSECIQQLNLPIKAIQETLSKGVSNVNKSQKQCVAEISIYSR